MYLIEGLYTLYKKIIINIDFFSDIILYNIYREKREK